MTFILGRQPFPGGDMKKIRTDWKVPEKKKKKKKKKNAGQEEGCFPIGFPGATDYFLRSGVVSTIRAENRHYFSALESVSLRNGVPANAIVAGKSRPILTFFILTGEEITSMNRPKTQRNPFPRSGDASTRVAENQWALAVVNKTFATRAVFHPVDDGSTRVLKREFAGIFVAIRNTALESPTAAPDALRCLRFSMAAGDFANSGRQSSVTGLPATFLSATTEASFFRSAGVPHLLPF